MLLIALTGSLATGKSTVSRILSSPPHSLPIIDADVLARQAVEPGTRAYKRIIRHFGPSTPDLLLPSPSPNDDSPTHHPKEAGKGRPLNRAALGRRVFGSTPERIRDRKFLNGIIHPRVRWAIVLNTFKYYIRGHWAVVLDIPLLYESGLDVFCPVVVMVAVSEPGVQMERLRRRDAQLSEREAGERVGSQGSVGEKVGRTRWRDGVVGGGGGDGGRGRRNRGYVVWNDGNKAGLETDIAAVIKDVEKGGRKGVWRWVFLLLWPVAIVWGVWEIYIGWRGRRAWERRKREEGKEQ